MYSRKAVLFFLSTFIILISAFFLLPPFADVTSLALKKISSTTTSPNPVAKSLQQAPPELPRQQHKENGLGLELELKREARTPEETATQRPPGCGIAHDFLGLYKNFTLQSDGLERTYWVYLPEDYDPDVEMPVVIGYAPKGTDALWFARFTGFSNPEVNPGMITVWPIAIDLSWEGAPSAPDGVSDLNFTTNLIHRLKHDYCIGPILATGHSNGAGFVGNLACSVEHGKAITGFAPVAGTFYTDVTGDEGCNVTADTTDIIRPILELHGDADVFALYDGGFKDAGKPIPSIPGWIRRWAVRNRCNMPPSEEDLGNKVDISYTCDGREGIVRHIKFKGHDHGWIGIDINGEYTDDFMTPYIISWFKDLQREPEEDDSSMASTVTALDPYRTAKTLALVLVTCWLVSLCKS